MAFTKITEADLQNKGVIGLPDTPGLSTTEMQEKFDEIALDVLYPKHNGLIDELALQSAASNIGAVDVNNEASTVQAELNKIKQGGYTKSETDQLLANKQDTEVGKGLSQNDFTNAYKDKLNGIEDNANNYVLPKGTQSTLGGVMGDGTTFTIDSNGVGHAVGGGGGGTSDYSALINKPSINHVELLGDKDGSEFGFLSPIITITSDAGSTVKIKKGATEITATQKTTTTWEAIPTSYGTWTVISSLAGADDATGTVEVDTVKTYATTVQHISATITVTYPSGATCKCSKGATEYIATSNPQTFTVRALGVWDIEVTYNGIVKTTTATISADGDSQSVTVEYASIVVTYDNNFKGTTISCSSGTTVYTKTAPSDASTVTFTIPTTGTWEVRGEVSGTQYTKSVTVSSYTSYSTSLAVFHATVTITFPYDKGAVCTLSDGTTTLTATTSPMAFSVPNTGTWTARSTLDGLTGVQNFNITTDGQTESYTFSVGTIELIYDNEFRGLSITCEKGVATITKTAPSTGNTMYFYPPTTGEWDISGTYSGTAYTTSATVSSLSTPVTAQLKVQVQKTITLYSAVEDLVTYTDINGHTVTEQFAENASSKSITVLIPNGGSASITFTSSVAKNPDNLSNYYSKTVSISSDTTSVFLMPSSDKVLYWWGYEGSNLEDCTSANGWSRTSLTLTAPTHNKNDVSCSTTSTTFSGIGTKNAISGSKIYMLGKYTTKPSSWSSGCLLLGYSNKSMTGSATVNVDNFGTSITKGESALPSNTYILGCTYSTSSCNIYALWYE